MVQLQDLAEMVDTRRVVHVVSATCSATRVAAEGQHETDVAMKENVMYRRCCRCTCFELRRGRTLASNVYGMLFNARRFMMRVYL